MEVIAALSLVVVLVLAFNHMVGGKAFHVLNPLFGAGANLMAKVPGFALTLLDGISKLTGEVIKIPLDEGNRKEPSRPWEKPDITRK